MDEFLSAVYSFFSQSDANDLLEMLATWQAADVSRHPKFDGDLAAALGSISCPAMMMPSRTDLYFRPRDSEVEVEMMSDAELRVIPSIHGHLAGLPGVAPPEDEEFVDRGLADLLAVEA
jgi:homoserine O-acetyltransferase/O-succinyltransferase